MKWNAAMSKHHILLALGLAMATSAGCVFESFEDPYYLSPANSNTMDAGNNTSTNNSTTADMGDAGDDVGTDMEDMGPDVPWLCDPLVLGGNGDTLPKIDLEPLPGGRFIASWVNESLELELRVIRDGEIVSQNKISGILSQKQPFDILAAPAERAEPQFFLARSRNNGVTVSRCTMSTCSPEADYEKSGTPRAIDGFWMGNGTGTMSNVEHYPYVLIVPEDGYLYVDAIVNGSPVNALNSQTSGTIDWASVAPYEIPDADPGLTTLLTAGTVDDGTVQSVQRITSGALEQPPVDCNVQPSNVRRVKAARQPNAERVLFADTQANEGITIRRLECGVMEQDIIDPVAELNDWDIVSFAGQARSFYAVSNNISTTLFSGEVLDTNTVALGTYRSVRATRNTDMDIGLLAMTGSGDVEFRQMSPTGECR